MLSYAGVRNQVRPGLARASGGTPTIISAGDQKRDEQLGVRRRRPPRGTWSSRYEQDWSRAPRSGWLLRAACTAAAVKCRDGGGLRRPAADGHRQRDHYQWAA